MRIEQHRAQFTVILFCTIAAVAGMVGGVAIQDTPSIIGALIGVLAYGGLAIAAYFRLRWAYLTTVIVSTLLTSAILVIDGETRGQFSPAFFILNSF